MSKVQRSPDVVEVHSEKAITYGVGAIFAFSVAAVLLYYRGQTGMFVPLGLLVLAIAIACLGYAIYCAFSIKKVKHTFHTCPFCEGNNALTELPKEDFLCISCNRLIPVLDGRILSVQQVRCGYCNELNYFSEKTDVLLCESCNHEVPIAHEEGHISKKILGSGFELILVDPGQHTDALISALQHMLALNRNQVKLMLNETPVTLLSGVPKKKAEMLRAQLSIHNAMADCRPMTESII
jgi:hypothetical protein